jgi:uncharacterized protein YoxC
MVKPQQLRREILKDLREISKDKDYRKRIESGAFSVVDGRLAITFHSILKCFELIAEYFKTVVESINTANINMYSELTSRVEQLRADITNLSEGISANIETVRSDLKNLQVRSFDTLSRHFRHQAELISNAPLSVEKSIGEVSKKVDILKNLELLPKKIDDFDKYLVEFRDTLEINQKMLIDTTEKIRARFDSISADVNEKCNALQTSFITLQNNIEAGIDNAVNKAFDGIHKKVSTELEYLHEKVDSISSLTADTAAAAYTTTTGAVEDISKRIKSEFDGFHQSLSKILSFVSEQALQPTIGEELQKALDNRLTKFYKSIEDTVITEIKDLKKAFEDLKYTIARYQIAQG